ncbi:MAG: hypothetical protein Q9N34_04695 [Aquificota bacterium]|nr:hypothetical protein [Aquificota bacterium]
MDDRERELFLNVLEERVKVTYLKKGINYDRFEMIVRRISGAEERSSEED